jgi:hypothetical protein
MFVEDTADHGNVNGNEEKEGDYNDSQEIDDWWNSGAGGCVHDSVSDPRDRRKLYGNM